jgi:phage recombination protein Bet
MAEPQERGAVSYESRDGQEIKLSFDTVRKYLVSGKPEFVTDQEIVLYMGTCKARGLNPFKKDCYLVKYTERDTAATIVSIDYYRSRAKAQADCVGWKSGIIILTPTNQLEYREGSFMLGGDQLVGGWFRAKPKHWDDEYTWTVSLQTYIKKTREGVITQFWREENQAYMIAKVAESQGLHRLWPDEFQGLMLDEEFKALRDVTQQPTPLRVPQAIGENRADEKTRIRKNSENVSEGKPTTEKLDRHSAGTRAPKEPVEQSKPQAPPPEPSEEQAQEDLINQLILWCESAPDGDFEDKAKEDWLFAELKKVKGTVNQMKVLKPFNDRRQAIAKH